MFISVIGNESSNETNTRESESVLSLQSSETFIDESGEKDKDEMQEASTINVDMDIDLLSSPIKNATSQNEIVENDAVVLVASENRNHDILGNELLFFAFPFLL